MGNDLLQKEEVLYFMQQANGRRKRKVNRRQKLLISSPADRSLSFKVVLATNFKCPVLSGLVFNM
jgi:hypothetical protein